jgi:hypothetical protein
MTLTTNDSGMQKPAAEQLARDASGYRIFSADEAGSAHVMAHRMLDENRLVEGHRLLGDWLRGRTGAGSEWVHLQFHMAVFEIAAGDWDAAHERYQEQVLPVAATSENAITDAPQLLWRLALAAPRETHLSWEPLRRTALARMQRPDDPYIELHNLLVLAGAGDLEGLVRWAQSRPARESTQQWLIVGRAASALVAYASKSYRQAAKIFSDLVPRIAEVGGSKAQNQLFEQIAFSSWLRSVPARSSVPLAQAA